MKIAEYSRYSRPRAFNSLLIVFLLRLLPNLFFLFSIIFVNVCVPISLWRHSHQVTGLVFSLSYVISFCFNPDPYRTYTHFSSSLVLSLHDEYICTWFGGGATIVINISDMHMYMCFLFLFINGITYVCFIQHFFPIQNSPCQKKGFSIFSYILFVYNY